MSEVFVKNLTKHYGKIKAVENLTFEVKSKETVAILGPSGCGKTTTLRMIAGLEKPTSGKIYIGGRDVTDLTPRERNIAMVFQFYAIYPGKTVYDNIAFPLKARGLSKNEIDKQVKNVAEKLNISSILMREAISCQMAEKQLVALARALVVNPDVLLLDEPLTILDAEHRGRMRVRLKNLLDNEGITCIYVTHDQTEALLLGHRLIVMKDGMMQQMGPPDELINNPTNEFVAGFIGMPPMNFLRGKVVENSRGSYYIDFGFNKIYLSKIYDSARRKIKGLNEITLGIRPWDVIITQNIGEKGVLNGVVTAVELIGDDMIIEIELAPSILITCMTKKSNISIGESIGVILPEEKCYLFDKNGNNIFACVGE